MMASWLLHLLVQKTVLYVLVSFDIFNLAVQVYTIVAVNIVSQQCCDEGSLAFLATGDKGCTI